MDKKYDIEEWVATRSFEELNEAEKAFVVSELGSKAGYTEMRRIVLSFQSENEEIVPGSVRHNIMDAFDLHHGSSDKKIIPIAQPRERKYKKVMAYVLLAASIIVAVFLILPDKSKSSNQQIAENKIKKEITSDSAEHRAKAKSDIEETAKAENNVKEEEFKSQPTAPHLKDSKTAEEDMVETESQEMSDENIQSFSAESDNDYAGSTQAVVITDAMQERDEKSVAEIAAPPQPVQELSLNKESKNTNEQQTGMRYESLLFSNAAPNFTFIMENFSQSHYISY